MRFRFYGKQQCQPNHYPCVICLFCIPIADYNRRNGLCALCASKHEGTGT